MAEGKRTFYSIELTFVFFLILHFLVEVLKLQKHLSLLREEYVKLQNKHSELERKYNLVSSIASQHNLNPHLDPNDNYITRLLKTISELFDKDLYRYKTSRGIAVDIEEEFDFL